MGWLGDRIKDATTVATGVAMSPVDEKFTDQLTRTSPEEREAAAARQEYYGWKILGKPTGAVLGAASGLVVPGSGQYVREGFDALGRSRLDRQAKMAEQRQQEAKQKAVAQIVRTLLALIKVESNGNPNAMSPSGSFYGLLQMGKAAASDVGISDPATLLGNPQLAVQAWLKYNQRYADRTGWKPGMMALLWKGGPGTAAKYTKLRDAGASHSQALADAAPANWNVPEYMRRFLAAYGE